ncbi:hypothetical protein BDQ12DRAFT_687884 [Crucibulum laeve]|uniref:Uncharacterized protein n=1 Tax=Crucibulum laeve TaxID=68775 RepID=A0A5C3LS55_9AGAR|nr:hypothetical protein BDQ12DRAFT_687884 [Crucibulum laeve]
MTGESSQMRTRLYSKCVVRSWFSIMCLEGNSTRSESLDVIANVNKFDPLIRDFPLSCFRDK